MVRGSSRISSDIAPVMIYVSKHVSTTLMPVTLHPHNTGKHPDGGYSNRETRAAISAILKDPRTNIHRSACLLKVLFIITRKMVKYHCLLSSWGDPYHKLSLSPLRLEWHTRICNTHSTHTHTLTHTHSLTHTHIYLELLHSRRILRFYFYITRTFNTKELCTIF